MDQRIYGIVIVCSDRLVDSAVELSLNQLLVSSY